MSFDRFQNYISATYIPEIIQEIKAKYPMFNTSTMKKKDQILRKFHFITLLCNTTQLHNLTKVETFNLKRKREEESESTSSIIPTKVQKVEDMHGFTTGLILNAMDSLEIQEPSYDPHSPESHDINVDEWEYDIEEEEAEKAIPEEEEKYRFVCPLMIGAANFSIRMLLIESDLSFPDSFPIETIDIIDRESKRAIFITNIPRSEFVGKLKDTYELSEELIFKIGTVDVNWKKGELTCEMCFSLNVKAAEDFLAKRVANLTTYYPDFNIEDIIEREIISNYVMERREKWASPIIKEMERKYTNDDFEELDEMPEEFPKISLPEIISLLLDVNKDSKRKEEAIWNGKILPFSLTEVIETEINEDKNMIKEFFPEIGSIDFCKGEDKYKESIEDTLIMINKLSKREDFSNFKTIDVTKNLKQIMAINNIEEKDEKCLESLLKTLGWEMKGMKRADGIENDKQPEYKPINKCLYPSWMEGVFLEECKNSGMIASSDILFNESEPTHPIDIAAAHACEEMSKIYAKKNIACTVAKYMNLCSRLTGSYLVNISKENKAHSSIAVMPIYFTASSEIGEDKKRYLSGFLIRGPHHVRDSTDKINCVIIEKIKKIKKRMYKKGIVFTDKKGKKWFATQNAFSRISPLYGSFLHDLLFLPTNFLGDIIFRSSDGNHSLLHNSVSYIKDNEDFLVHRMTEIALMGLLGGSQEEGYFSGYRMLYMILLELSRGNACAVMDPKGFIDSLNECVLSNCFVIFMHCSVLRTLHYINEIISATHNEFVVIGGKD